MKHPFLSNEIMNNYELFYQLHHNTNPLVIGNAWNAKSAQLIEMNGYAAIGTSSGAISNAMGYEDGEKIPFDELLYIITRITSCTKIPVSVDIERGYADNLKLLTDNIQRLIDVGVVGINIEDAQGEELYLQKLNAIKNYLEQKQQKIFINARTDGFLQKLESPLELTIKRAKRYLDAGADGLFVTAVSDANIIKQICASTALPVNVVGSPKLSSFKMLSECGVKRISMAVLPYKAVYNHLGKVLNDIKVRESFDPIL